MRWWRLVLTLVLLPAMAWAAPVRIKDLATVDGVRGNDLVGYGLVVGLNGTGDQTGQTPFTVQSLKAMLNRFGVQIPAETRLQLACDLIQDGRLAICEIAASVGYESRHAFSRSFKRATGVTATDFRLACGNG